MKKRKFYFKTIILLSFLFGVIFFILEVNYKNSNYNLGENNIVIYSSRGDNLLDATIPLFEEKYGVQVELVKGELGELLTKIRKEKDNPKADIIMGGTYSYMYSHRDLFEEYVSVNDKYILDNYRNTTGLTTSYILEGSCFIVNKSLAKDIRIKGYEDLLNTKLKGKIIMGNPLNSSLAFSNLSSALLAMGGYEDDLSWDYIKNLIKQIGEITSNSEKVYTNVASGSYIVGLTYESPCTDLLMDLADIEIIYPKEGTIYLPATMAIIEGCNNQVYAKHFVDFMTSKDMQNIYANILMKRSVYKDVIEGEYLTPIDEIYVLEEDSEYVKENTINILSRYSLIIDEIMGE